MNDPELTKLREAIEEIQWLVSWHYDINADPKDHNPKDMTAHVNGLVYQICERTKNKP